MTPARRAAAADSQTIDRGFPWDGLEQQGRNHLVMIKREHPDDRGDRQQERSEENNCCEEGEHKALTFYLAIRMA